MMDTKPSALVTGASRGIGAATARALAADGYRVIVHYGANRAKAEQVASDIRADGGSAEIVCGDLSDPATPQTIARQVGELCGGGLQALVLNAGIMPATSNFTDCPPDVFDHIFAVNLRAPFFLLQHLAPVLTDGASVVMLSSVTARRAIGAVAAYGAMKAAIESMVLRAAAEFGSRNIRVNAVAPATTETETVAPWTQSEAGRNGTLGMQALKRINQPEDIADVIAFLCSNKARVITGAVVPADGGTLL
jgi:3-oxoacyl-[acyl-carrier protein] reductase